MRTSYLICGACPNPYWSVDLRGLTGLDSEFIEFLDAEESFNDMYEDIVGFLNCWIPRFEEAHRRYLTIAIGCTGGQHRWVRDGRENSGETSRPPRTRPDAA